MYAPSTGRTERLDGVIFALFHLSLHATAHDGYALTRVNAVRIDGVSIQVAATLYLVLFPVNFHGVRFHHFLHGFTDIAQTHVDSGRFDARLRRLVHRLQQRIVHIVKRLGERAIDDASLDLNPEIKLDDVVLSITLSHPPFGVQCAAM